MGESKRRKASGDYPDTSKPKVSLGDAMMAVHEAAKHGVVTTPALPESDNLRKLIDSIVPGGKPVELPFTNFGASNLARFCQLNVSRQVKTVGGQRVDGWMLWENPAFAEAEAHSVWQDDDGNLIDITPRVDREETILFLPDPTARIIRTQHQGKDVDRLLNNRTTIPEAPYTSGGMPCDGPFHFHEYPEGARATMLKTWRVEGSASL